MFRLLLFLAPGPVTSSVDDLDSPWINEVPSGSIKRQQSSSASFKIFTPLLHAPKHARGSFMVIAKNNSLGPVYIESATLNGEPLDRSWLDFKEVMAGGKLELVLGLVPNKQRGEAK